MAEQQDEVVIPLVEERVRTAKREVETGRVRVHTRVEQHKELLRGELAREEVDVRRVPLDQEITAIPDIRQDGDTTIIPVVEEVLVVEKKLMLVEEIHLTRRRVVAPYEEEIVLARQQAEIERDPSGTPTP